MKVKSKNPIKGIRLRTINIGMISISCILFMYYPNSGIRTGISIQNISAAISGAIIHTEDLYVLKGLMDQTVYTLLQI